MAYLSHLAIATIGEMLYNDTGIVVKH